MLFKIFGKTQVKLSPIFRYFRYFYLFATQLHYLKMPKEKKKKNVGRDGEEA